MNLKTLSLKELSEVHGKLAVPLGLKIRHKWHSKAEAIKVIARVQEQARTGRRPPNKVRTRFIYKPNGNIVEPRAGQDPRWCTNDGDNRSLRSRVLDALKVGSTFADIRAVVEQFDKARCVVNTQSIRRRTFDTIHMMNQIHGYGLRQEGNGDEKTIIFAYTEEQGDE